MNDRDYVSLTDLSWIDESYHDKLGNKNTYSKTCQSILKKICERYGNNGENLYIFLNMSNSKELLDNMTYQSFLYYDIIRENRIRWINRFLHFSKYLKLWGNGPFYKLEYNLSYIDEINKEVKEINAKSHIILESLFNVKSFDDLFKVYDDDMLLRKNLNLNISKVDGNYAISKRKIDHLKYKDDTRDFYDIEKEIIGNISTVLIKDVCPKYIYHIYYKYEDASLAEYLFKYGRMNAREFINSKYYMNHYNSEESYISEIMDSYIFNRLLADNYADWKISDDFGELFDRIKDKSYRNKKIDFKNLNPEDIQELYNDIILEKMI